jgi:predicted enzyme related to lactoylglutathione lyase
VRATGGSAPEPAQFSFGWTVDCCDDQDTPFSLWEMAPGLFPPERRGDGKTPGEPAYFVLSTPAPERGAAFYGAVLGWEFEPAEANGYRHAANLRLPGGLAQLPRPGLHLWFRTHGIEETCRRLVGLGGTAGERSASASGISCDCVDPFGVAFALWQPAPGL